MQKWEHLSVKCFLDEKEKKWVYDSDEKRYYARSDMFTDLGDQGWELASSSTWSFPIANSGQASTQVEYFYFKRPKS